MQATLGIQEAITWAEVEERWAFQCSMKDAGIVCTLPVLNSLLEQVPTLAGFLRRAQTSMKLEDWAKKEHISQYTSITIACDDVLTWSPDKLAATEGGSRVANVSKGAQEFDAVVHSHDAALACKYDEDTMTLPRAFVVRVAHTRTNAEVLLDAGFPDVAHLASPFWKGVCDQLQLLGMDTLHELLGHVAHSPLEVYDDDDHVVALDSHETLFARPAQCSVHVFRNVFFPALYDVCDHLVQEWLQLRLTYTDAAIRVHTCNSRLLAVLHRLHSNMCQRLKEMAVRREVGIAPVVITTTPAEGAPDDDAKVSCATPAGGEAAAEKPPLSVASKRRTRGNGLRVLKPTT